MISNLNLDNIKVVIFDYDGTLAVHRDKDFVKHRNENVDKRLNYYANAYQNPSNFYIDIEPCDRSEALYKLIQELRNKNIKMYCLSGMKFSFHFKAKQDFINTQYGDDIELISAGTQELKLDGIKIILKLKIRYLQIMKTVTAGQRKCLQISVRQDSSLLTEPLHSIIKISGI